jgi:hypothetical protein
MEKPAWLSSWSKDSGQGHQLMMVHFLVLPRFLGNVELDLTEIIERLTDLCIFNSPVVTLTALSVLLTF